MPVYVYKNLRTGEKFEVEQRITEPALTEHPKSGDPVKRLIQPVGIAFKGSGFYVNDSRSGSNGSSTKKDRNEPTSTGDSKSEPKSESKADSKTDSKPESKSGSNSSPEAGKSAGETKSTASKSSD